MFDLIALSLPGESLFPDIKCQVSSDWQEIFFEDLGFRLLLLSNTVRHGSTKHEGR